MLCYRGGNGLIEPACGHAGKGHGRIQMKIKDYTIYKYSTYTTQSNHPRRKSTHQGQVNYYNDLAPLSY